VSEFDLIQRFFTRATPGAILGVGDDAALLHVAEGTELVVSTDMLVSGTHFLPDADPFLLGHKTLAVNLSDLAAMGAVPRWATLTLSLPAADADWLQRFSAGFFALADEHGVDLVGGDTTRGPLSLSVTIMGEVPSGKALRRSGAKPGDDIWVSGMLGHAALGLAHLQGRTALPEDTRIFCLAALHQPQPRVMLGLALRDIASSAIDVSDGLLADLGHILERSHAGAELEFDTIPTGIARDVDEMLFRHCVLSGGDDYELCFTASMEKRSAIEAVAKRLGLPLTRIGRIGTGQGCTLRSAKDGVMTIKESGYDHFA
jgi:thiamine-monophosphate kinase